MPSCHPCIPSRGSGSHRCSAQPTVSPAPTLLALLLYPRLWPWPPHFSQPVSSGAWTGVDD